MTFTSTQRNVYLNKTTLTSWEYALEGAQYKWSNQKLIESKDGSDLEMFEKSGSSLASPDTIDTSSKGTHKLPGHYWTSQNKQWHGTTVLDKQTQQIFLSVYFCL